MSMIVWEPQIVIEALDCVQAGHAESRDEGVLFAYFLDKASLAGGKDAMGEPLNVATELLEKARKGEIPV